MCRQTHESVVTRMPAARLHARAPLPVNLVRVHTAAHMPGPRLPMGLPYLARLLRVYSLDFAQADVQALTETGEHMLMHSFHANECKRTRCMAKLKSHGKARALMPTRHVT